MIVVTGGAGFIGANIVKALNHRGIENILVVDNLGNANKFQNLADCMIADFIDKRDFMENIVARRYRKKFMAVFHNGACSDTMEYDGRYMMQNNYEYSKALLHHCQEKKTPFLYASSAAVYGAGRRFEENTDCEHPLNIYGYSKWLFDQNVRRALKTKTAQIAGFRYFNVYGPREAHKRRMASVAYHHFNQYQEFGKVKLFGEYGGYKSGEQRRDFISVDDVIAVNLFFFDHPGKSGIFNLGSGRSQPFNDVAATVVNTFRKKQGKPSVQLDQLQREGEIEYIPFPEALMDKYQCFTQADLTLLRKAGFKKSFLSVEQGVERYISQLYEHAKVSDHHDPDSRT